MQEEQYNLILFISGMSVRSVHAIENAKEILKKHLPGTHELQIIDIRVEPDKAREFGIFAIPTLLKTKPLPKRLLVGDLSDKNKVLKSLDIL